MNVARGKHIVTEDLVKALTDNEIAGARFLTSQTLNPSSWSSLWNLPNCLITPHTANTPEMGIELLSLRVTENVSRYLQGFDLIGCIDIDSGY